MTRAPLAVTAAFALLSAMHLIHLQLTGNFHEVVPGELYRSAQLSAGDLVTYAREKDIRSVLNLRGADRGAPWYLWWRPFSVQASPRVGL